MATLILQSKIQYFEKSIDFSVKLQRFILVLQTKLEFIFFMKHISLDFSVKRQRLF